MLTPNPTHFEKLATMKMPFGKYKDVILINLPEPYVVWMKNNALPKGELGILIQELYEIKVNGLEYLFRDLANTK